MSETKSDTGPQGLLLLLCTVCASLSLGLAVYDLLTGGAPLRVAFGFATALFATLGFAVVISTR